MMFHTRRYLHYARALLLACVLLLLPLARGGAADPENAGEALLRRVGERYAAAHTLSAKFRQEIPLQNVGIVRKASGVVYFGRPLKMRWDYKGPEPQLFLADGRYFYFRPAGATNWQLVGVYPTAGAAWRASLERPGSGDLWFPEIPAGTTADTELTPAKMKNFKTRTTTPTLF